MQTAEQDVLLAFEKDVSDHVLTVIKDEGLYRHLRFARPGSSIYSFNIITWPGYLCYTGDMGTFVFSRVPDMLEFFRHERPNLSYWHEKLQAIDARGRGSREFSLELFTEKVWERARDFFDDFVGNIRTSHRDECTYGGNAEACGCAEYWQKDLFRQVKEDIIECCDGWSADACYQLVRDFEWNDRYPFENFWEVNCEDYTYHYVWCCYALVFAVKTYDAYKSVEECRQGGMND